MIPEAGVHYNIPEPEYRAWEAANYSGLKRIAISTEQYAYELKHPEPQTEAMLLGSATDTYILSPNQYDTLYYELEEDVDLRTKGGKETWALAEIEARGRKILRPHQWEPIHSMREAVYEHRVAAEFLESGDPQVVVVWDDEETQVRCKARIDWLNGTRLVDIKTTATQHIDTFGRQAFNLGYHIQAAMYSDGARQAGIEVSAFSLIVVQSEAPFRVKTLHFNDASLDAGRSHYRRALYDYRRCLDANDWSDYQADIEITIPEWYLRYEGIDYE